MKNLLLCSVNLQKPKQALAKFSAFLFCLTITNLSLAQNAPEENRFTKVVLGDKLDEPMEMTLLKDGRVLFVERKGALKQFDPNTGVIKTIAAIPVNTKYTNAKGQKREAEEGLMGLIHDPNFEKNHWIYMYYADTAKTQHVLARWELKGDELVASSKKVVLEVPTQREECCHTGGGMVFDKAGNLYLTVGNNTSNSGSDGYANLDERKGWAYWDDQRGAGNTNSLTGKILRITPKEDGSYTIPKGNLYETLPNNGDGLVKKEIYTMGHRNPWRPTIDSKTGYLYWGEVGPDASVDGEQGPRGYDEFNQARGASNFGWPYFIGDNKVYTDWDFETKKVRPDSKYDPLNPINDSPNNTGLKNLPPAQKAFIWYPYGISEDFPLVGSSGRSATGGPVFHKSDFPNGQRVFPDYYEGKWLITDFMRGWIMSVSMDESGNYKSMERFMPNTDFGSAIDMDFAPDGDLYVLEYGSAWFKGNDNARLVKVEYNGGNRMPKVVASADNLTGAAPLKVNFSSKGTMDYDGDKLTYLWEIKSKAGKRVLKTENPSITFDKAGTYDVTLTVKDSKGETNSESLEVKVGNESPAVAFNIKKGNKTFYFPNKPIEYEVSVADKEDGDLNSGKIKPDQVSVSIDYLQIGYDKIEASQNHRGVDASAFASMGERMLNKNDCKSCHIIDTKSVGPSYRDIATRYKSDAKAIENLSNKVIAGGGGVWGDHRMAAHPQISQAEANIIVEYILNINEPKTAKSLPTKGNYDTKVPTGQKENGSYILRAAYKDKGTKVMKSLATEDLIVLRNAKLNPEISDKSKGTQLTITPMRSFSMVGNNAYLAYNNVDLTDISEIEIAGQAQTRVGASGGIVEIRLDSPTGTVIGKSEQIEPQEVRFGPAPAAPAGSAAPAAPQRRPPSKFKIAVPANSGQHDVYFVFKNDKAKDSQIIMSVSAIEFKPVGAN
ncbi:PQQ-dependent sugar dehydrogenase [Arcicella sp. LKC2W]|uniref:PQQ-dependent sugar dehydrogenase n=1 Tax=Arcicella sp. LKC2W TaxID=2984198 RepID=UPI002B1F9094|nr:PQQ-dependent sugar dehydrogenase [Arcicella sp. LKC2W]MEA5458418.1 PQQ-dependent sugar dehydrogenase [Arcicella sp. LKC2W]